jgi:alkaline phosphatase
MEIAMSRTPVCLILSTMVLTMYCAAAPKNIILFIGDGMGTSQLTAAKYAKGELQIERCPIGGFATTHSSNKFVTDSAAGGTALATGHKTTNGTVSQTPDGKPLKTVLEVAEARGKSTGLVSTSAITHATPASFGSHVPSRRMQAQIAEQLAAKEIEVLFGGGYGFFIPQSEKGSKRKDDKNVLEILKSSMIVVSTEEEFNALGIPKRVAGLFADDGLPKVSEGRIELAAMTEKAIQVLAQNKRGFFLMVEGSQVDWGGHANNTEYILSEMIAFDNAVGAGLDFAKLDGNTLVIVTADHETGGFSVLDGSVASNTVSKTAFTTKKHSATMVPVLAYGPGSDAFGGIIDNTDIGEQIIQYLEENQPGFFKRLFQ